MEAPVLMRPTSAPDPAVERLPIAVALFVAAAGALLVGMLTSIAQGSPVQAVATAANAAGPWFVLTALLVLVVRPRLPWALVLGFVCIELMHVGYTTASNLGGHPDVLSVSDPWVLLGVVAGPLAGAVAWAVSAGDPRARGVASGVVGAVLLGEGIRGLLAVAATTGTSGWVLEIVAGAVVAAAGVLLTRSPVVRVLALGTALVGTAVVIGGYAVLEVLGS